MNPDWVVVLSTTRCGAVEEEREYQAVVWEQRSFSGAESYWSLQVLLCGND
jgi:hypothetical protein